MSTRYFGDVRTGSTSMSLNVLLLKFTDGTPLTGQVAGDLTAYYYRQGAAGTVAITLSDLAALNTAYTVGGIKEIGDGTYLLHAPDAMFASGADWVEITIKAGSAAMHKERIRLEAHGADDVCTIAPSWYSAPVTPPTSAAIASAVLSQTLSAARDLSAVADTSLTVNDALHCATAATAGRESISGTTYQTKTSAGTLLRQFTLDSAVSPTSRT